MGVRRNTNGFWTKEKLLVVLLSCVFATFARFSCKERNKRAAFFLTKNAKCKKEICVVIHVIYELNWLLWAFFRMDFLKHVKLKHLFFLTELKMKPQKLSESEKNV